MDAVEVVSQKDVDDDGYVTLFRAALTASNTDCTSDVVAIG